MKSTIGRKIGAAFLAIILLMGAMVGITFQGFTKVISSLGNMELETVKRGASGNLRFSIAQLVMATNDYIITEKEYYHREYNRLSLRVDDFYEQFTRLPLTNEEQQLVGKIKQDFDSIRAISVQILAIQHPRQSPKAWALMETMEYRFGRDVNLKTTQIFDGISRRIEEYIRSASADKQNTMNSTYGVTFLGILISLVLSYFTVQRISKPIVAVTKAANSIAKGDYSQRPVVNTHDEVAILAKAFSRMAESIQTSQEALMKSEKQYRDLSDTTSDLIQVFSPEGKLLYANRAWRETLGYTEEETRTITIDQMVHPDQQLHCRNVFNKVVQGEKINTFNINLITKEGETISAEGNLSCQYESGTPKSITLFLRDVTEQISTELKLRESEKLLGLFFEQSIDGFFFMMLDKPVRWDETVDKEKTLEYVFAHQRITKVNNAMLAQYGATSEQYLGATPKELFVHDIEYGKKVWRKIFDHGRSHIETEERKIDGSQMWIEGDYICLYDDEGRISGHFGVQHEITERKIRDEALRESEERFRTLTETAASIIIIYQGEYLQYVNHAAKLLLGYTKEELLSMKYWEIIHPDHQEMARERGTARGRGENVPNEIEIKVLTKTGDVRWVTFTFAMLQISGKPAVLGTAFDITDRKKAEADLVENKNYLQKVIETEPECVKVINSNGELLEINAAGLAMLESESIADIRRHTMNNFIKPQYQLQYKELLSRTLHGERSMLEFEITGLKGTHRWLETHAAPIIDNQGSVIKVVEVIRDITERKKAEIQLQINEERYRSIVENVREAYYEANARSLFTYCNPGSVLMSGYNQDEFNKMSCFRLVAEEHRTKIRNRYLQWVKEQRTTMISEFLMQTKTGEKLWVEQTTYFEYGKGGNVLNTTNFIKNIEERKKSERQIEMLAHALRSINDCVSITNLNDTFIFVNEVFSALYGYEPHEVIGKNISILRSPNSDSKVLSEILREAKINGWRGEVLNRKKNGDEFLVALSTSVIRDDDGIIIALIYVAQDISERKTIEDKLRTHYRVMEQSGATIIITNAKGNIEYVNAAVVKKTGYTFEEVIGKNPRIFQSGHTPKEEYQRLWKTILAGNVWHAEILNKKKNGEQFWEEKSISPIYDDHGIISHIVGIGEDITEKKRLSEHLIQSQKAESIGTLASGIAHDFNNVLGIILAYTGFIEKTKSDEKVTSENLQAITKAVHRGANLVKQILTFARKTDTSILPMNVKELIDEITSILQKTFPKKFEITVEFDKNLPPISADRIKMYQAIMNLCVNARDAMPNGGTITIRATTMSRRQLPRKYAADGNEKFMALSVSDTGTGMSAETIQRIFDPFFTTKEFGKGTGLGLSVVYGIVQLHSGYIDVVSELEKGTTFTLYLPITDQNNLPDVSEKVPRLAVQGGTETILVVEDEELLLVMIKTILESNGYTVVVARNGEEAVNIYKLKKDSIHLVLTDMGLPKLTGFEEFKKMKEINPEVKVIFASGYFEPTQKSELYKHGAMAFVQKPYAGNEILQVIREALG